MTTDPSAASDLDDAIAQARRGDRDAMEVVLLSLAPSIRRFGLRMCGHVEDAEDVLQDTLINVARHLGEFEGRSSVASWAYALTRSACARKRRGLRNQPHANDGRLVESPDAAPSPETRVADDELTSALSTALDRLSEQHREVIVLRDIEGLSAQDAAASIGISVDALKSRLHRAREALRDAFLPLVEPPRARATSCPDVVELWSKKLEGDLSHEDCSAMEKHIETCSDCAVACSALKRALLVCQHANTDEVPVEIQARVKAAVRAWAERTVGDS